MSNVRFHAMTLLLGSIGGCTPRTELIIEIDTDIPPCVGPAAMDEECLHAVRLVVHREGKAEPVVREDFVCTPESCAIDGGAGADDAAAPNPDRPDGGPSAFHFAGTFGLYSDDGSETPITVDVLGNPGALGPDQPLVQRTAILPLARGQTTLLRMPLSHLCVKKPPCPGGQTCVDGNCETASIDPKTLLPYGDGEVVGMPQCGGYFNTTPSGDGTCPPDLRCVNGQCVPRPKECENWLKDGYETDRDCGGGQCAPCGDHLLCLVGRDCTSGVCTDGRCAEPTCQDGVKNRYETDIDCGGNCPACAIGSGCGSNADCLSQICQEGRCANGDLGMAMSAVPLSCSNLMQDRNESDVDCGGVCLLCGDGKKCMVNADCQSRNCMSNVCAATQTGILLAAPITSPTGQKPIEIVTGRFGNMGHLDMATANTDGKSVSVLLGHGDGTFALANTIALGFVPSGIAAADLNSDGMDDLIVPVGDGSEIVVLLCMGAGAFSAPQRYPTGKWPNQPAIADLDKDGRQDVIVPNWGSDDVSVLTGSGKGMLNNSVRYPVCKQPRRVVAQQFDDDGLIDVLVVCDGSGAVDLLKGQVRGVLSASARVQMAQPLSSIWGMIAGDFNGDSKNDFMVPYNTTQSTVALYLNKGAGIFAESTRKFGTVGVTVLAAADLNGDGTLDLVRTQLQNISTQRGNGDGTFVGGDIWQNGKDGTDGGAWVNTANITTADFNEDGKPDVATTVSIGGSGAVLVFLNSR